jgi:hypothetical protein
VTCLIGFSHVASYIMFRYFLRISKDEEAFMATPPIELSENASRKSLGLVEFLRVFPFAFFPIHTGLRHLLLKNTHPLCTAIEMIGFTTVWALLWRWNIKNEKWRWARILIFFAIQMTLMYYIRAIFYTQW